MGLLERLREYLESLPQPPPDPVATAPDRPRPESGPFFDDRVDVPRYSFEVRLSRRRGSEMVLSRAGRILLALPGRDAVSWLLALEMAQAQSANDPFRLSATAAKEMLARGSWFIDYAHSQDPEEKEPAAYWTLDRLQALGVLTIVKTRHGGTVYDEDHSLTPEGRSIFSELTRETESRWNTLASACIAEEQGAVLDDLLPVAHRFQRENAAEASAREARLVAHEVRNALGPVRYALNRLVTAVGDTEAQKQLARVEEGVTRLYRFVDDRLHMTEVLEQSGETFPIDAALRDLLGLESPPDLALAASGAEVRGPRSSVIASIREMVRNAHLANHPRTVQVRIASERRNGHVIVLIEDDGAGVPPGDRDRVFQRGVSLRGGGGEGLALAKDVFERAMGGTIRCGESSLGGARFEIVLPAVLAIPRSSV